MITREEYLKAKAIVDEYERLEFEEGCRQADWEMEEDEEDESTCELCGEENHRHLKGCIYKDPLDFNECGYG